MGGSRAHSLEAKRPGLQSRSHTLLPRSSFLICKRRGAQFRCLQVAMAIKGIMFVGGLTQCLQGAGSY